MESLTIDLNSETLAAVERAAKREGISVSAWARKHLATAAKEEGGWPEDYFERIATFGGIELEEPREVSVALDEISLDSPSKAE